MALTKDDALAIAKKLGGKIVTDRKGHDLAQIWHGEKVIAMFGIRRGRRDLGHNHIRHKIFVRQRQAQDLANCPMSKNDWLEIMEKAGKLEKK